MGNLLRAAHLIYYNTGIIQENGTVLAVLALIAGILILLGL